MRNEIDFLSVLERLGPPANTLVQVLETRYKRETNVLGTCSISDCTHNFSPVTASDNLLSTAVSGITCDPRL